MEIEDSNPLHKRKRHNSRRMSPAKPRSTIYKKKHNRQDPKAFNKRQNIKRLKRKQEQRESLHSTLKQVLPNFKLHNFTNKVLTEEEQSALCMGPTMIVARPASQRSREEAAVKIKHSVEKFIRSIMLRILFSETPSAKPSPFRVPNPAFDPTPHVKLEPLVSDYINKLRNRVNKYITSHDFQSTHLSRKNRVPGLIIAAWRRLLDDPDIRICKADKNLGLCLVTTAWYVEECLRHLTDRQTYYVIDWMSKDEIINSMLQGLRLILESCPAHIRKDAEKYIDQDYGKNLVHSLCGFYILPKIHKAGPLKGRPICPNPNTPLYYASKYLHIRLKPLMLNAPTYLKYSLDFVRKLSTLPVPASCYIVAADVESLYPSIPINNTTLTLIQELLESECTNPEMHILASEIPFIMQLLAHVLLNNYVSFQGKIYRQISGTAMGKPVETKAHNTAIARQYTLPLLNARYIDDYCFIFPTHDSATNYLSLINHMHPNIKLNYYSSIDPTSREERPVPFLDLEIFKKPQSSFLLTRLYRKPQNAYLYLLPGSFHPPHIFPNFIKSELTRIRTACSLDEDCTSSREFFRERLLERGYTSCFLNPIFNSHEPSRDSVLNRPPRRQSNPRLTLVVEHNVHTAKAPLKWLLRPGWTHFARKSVEIFGTYNHNKGPYIAFTVLRQLHRALNHQPLPTPIEPIRKPRVCPRGPFRLIHYERELARRAHVAQLTLAHTPSTVLPITDTPTTTSSDESPRKRTRTDIYNSL